MAGKQGNLFERAVWALMTGASFSFILLFIFLPSPPPRPLSRKYIIAWRRELTKFVRFTLEEEKYKTRHTQAEGADIAPK